VNNSSTTRVSYNAAPRCAARPSPKTESPSAKRIHRCSVQAHHELAQLQPRTARLGEQRSPGGCGNAATAAVCGQDSARTKLLATGCGTAAPVPRPTAGRPDSTGHQRAAARASDARVNAAAPQGSPPQDCIGRVRHKGRLVRKLRHKRRCAAGPAASGGSSTTADAPARAGASGSSSTSADAPAGPARSTGAKAAAGHRLATRRPPREERGAWSERSSGRTLAGVAKLLPVKADSCRRQPCARQRQLRCDHALGAPPVAGGNETVSWARRRR